ncbi:hypothetical protein ACFLIM_48330 [Nonomuraea sp. M3C6]|uniref:Uncharacterized protein n=1 Tax=Nonomuraea marmarensis TaxID=3351344 RepID=A0ABW7AY54_9ACTN
MLLALGVVGMHTLGHLASHHGEAVVHGSGVHASPLMYADQHRNETVIGAGDVVGVDPSSMCLAVLTSIAALLMAATWVATLRWRVGLADWVSRARMVARSPPRRLTPGHTKLSVMRI